MLSHSPRLQIAGKVAAALLFLACVTWTTGFPLVQKPPIAPVAHLVPIPDTWKNPPSGKLASSDGYSWYRCLVKVPASWKEKPLDLFVEPVDDARAIYVNGVQ